MKKILLSIMLVVTGFAAVAQPHTVQSFLNVQSLQVSNVAAISNLVMWPGMSNIFGGRWTNSQGTAINVTNAGNTVQLVRDVTLWSDRDGNVPYRQFYEVQGSTTNYITQTPFAIYLRYIGGSGANGTVTFKFTPYWADHTAGDQPFVATTHDFTVAITSASGVNTFATNIANVAWQGAKGVRVRSIVNGDTDYTGGIYITDLDLVGFRP